MYDYCNRSLEHKSSTDMEMTFSIYGKDVHFVWDVETEEWVPKELSDERFQFEMYKIHLRQRELLITVWAVFCIVVGVMAGACLGWMARG